MDGYEKSPKLGYQGRNRQNFRPRSSQTAKLGGLLVAGGLAATLICWLFVGGGTVEEISGRIPPLDAAGLQATIQDLGPVAPLASVGLMILHAFVPFSLEALALANGLVFGVPGGLAVTWIGMMLGAWTGYGAARIARPLAYRIAGGNRLEQLEQWTSQCPTWQLITVRCVPVLSFSLLNLAMGLLRVTLWRFTWTTAIGILPLMTVAVVAGSVLIFSPWAWAAIFATVAGYLSWRLLAKLRRGRQ